MPELEEQTINLPAEGEEESAVEQKVAEAEGKPEEKETPEETRKFASHLLRDIDPEELPIF